LIPISYSLAVLQSCSHAVLQSCGSDLIPLRLCAVVPLRRCAVLKNLHRGKPEKTQSYTEGRLQRSRLIPHPLTLLFILRSFRGGGHNLQCVIPIQFLKIGIGKEETIQWPMITKEIMCIKMFVSCFEYPESQSVCRLIRHIIGSVDKPVLVFFNEIVRELWDWFDLCVTINLK